MDLVEDRQRSFKASAPCLHTIASMDSPSRGPAEEAVFAAMQSFHFQIAGVTRSHWDFYQGYELSITVVFATYGGTDLAAKQPQ